MAIWLPGYERKDLGPDGGPYDRQDNPKLLWHTWEGYNWSAAEGAFLRYPPHIAVSPRNRLKRQYVSLDRHAYALAGSDTEDSWVIQVEIAGFAANSQDWPQEDLEWLGTDVLRPILDAGIPIPPVICPQGFHGAGEGMVLASTRSPIRFPDVRAWDAFSGHVGHQHAPPPDEHWDPGRLNVQAIINAAGGSSSSTTGQAKMIDTLTLPADHPYDPQAGVEFRVIGRTVWVHWQAPNGPYTNWVRVLGDIPIDCDCIQARVAKGNLLALVVWHHESLNDVYEAWQVKPWDASGQWWGWIKTPPM